MSECEREREGSRVWYGYGLGRVRYACECEGVDGGWGGGVVSTCVGP